MPTRRRMKAEEREKGTGVVGALVRHVKLTNRSGLASFRIPRGHRVGPLVCARSGIPVIAPSSAPPFTDQGEGKRERDGEGERVRKVRSQDLQPLATVRPVVRALSIRIHYREIRFSTIPDALPSRTSRDGPDHGSCLNPEWLGGEGHATCNVGSVRP